MIKTGKTIRRMLEYPTSISLYWNASSYLRCPVQATFSSVRSQQGHADCVNMIAYNQALFLLSVFSRGGRNLW